MNRRRAAIGVAAGGVAVLAGIGVALHRRDGPLQNGEALWSRRFARLDRAEPLLASSLRGRPLLLNFWAPWCVPCVAELPLLDQFLQAQPASGWQVLALAVDLEAPVRAFVAEHRVMVPVAMAGDDGLALAHTLGNHVGGLPFSAGFDSDGVLRATRVGSLDAGLLQRWVAGQA